MRTRPCLSAGVGHCIWMPGECRLSNAPGRSELLCVADDGSHVAPTDAPALFRAQPPARATGISLGPYARSMPSGDFARLLVRSAYVGSGPGTPLSRESVAS